MKREESREKWEEWRVECLRDASKLLRGIDATQSKVINASIRNSTLHRVMCLLKNETGKWFRMVGGKKRDLQTPVLHNLKTG